MKYKVEIEYTIRGFDTMIVEPEDEDSVRDAVEEMLDWGILLNYADDREIDILSCEEIEDES